MLIFIPLVVASASGIVGVEILKNRKKRKTIHLLQNLINKRKQGLKKLPSAKKEKPLINTEKNSEEQLINRYLAVSSASLAVVTAGTLFYTPLVLLSIPGLIYGIVPIWQRAYKALVYEKKVKIALLHSIALPGMILSGYFFLATLSYVFYYVSEKLLLKTKDRSIKSLTHIFGEQPQVVSILADGVEIEIAFETLQVGDIVVIHAGQSIPVDGKIVNGYGSIDQRMLTGESQPAEKGMGERVFAATLLLEGKLDIQVEKAGQETVADKIGDILLHTTDFKSTVQLKGEKLADQSTLPILCLGVLALPLSPMAALTVLNADIGDIVRLVTPLSLLNFLQLASQKGILIKDGRALELLSEVDTVVFDKTGTLTLEQPHVGSIYTCDDVNENELLSITAAAENKQTHPIAQAIINAAKERQLRIPKRSKAKYNVGHGLKVCINQQIVLVGSKHFIELSEISIPADIAQKQDDCNEQGYSLVYVAIDNKLAGAIELHVTPRPEAQHIIRQLRERGLELIIISGDQEKPTQKLAEKLGITHYFSQTLPENKASLIEQLQAEGKSICFIGDGINDTIALKKANVSISLSGASSIATDTAAIILMDGSLSQLNELFKLAEDLNHNMKRNFISSILPGVITIGGAFFFHFGIMTAIVLYNVGLVGGLANAMQPMIKK